MTVTDGLYGTLELCRLSGCTQRQADYWAKSGVLVPVVPARGSGSKRRYTLDEVAMARVCVRMSLLCCNGAVMGAAVAALRAFPQLWSGKVLVLEDGTIIPSGVGAGREGWLLNLAACRAYVGAVPVMWDGSTGDDDSLGVAVPVGI